MAIEVWTISAPDNPTVPKIEMPSREDALTAAKELFWPFALRFWPVGKPHRAKVYAYFPRRPMAEAEGERLAKRENDVEFDVIAAPRVATWVLAVGPDGATYKIAPRGKAGAEGRFAFDRVRLAKGTPRWPGVFWRERSVPYLGADPKRPERQKVFWTEPGDWVFVGRFRSIDTAVRYAGQIERYRETMGDPLPPDPRDVTVDNLPRWRIRPFEADVRTIEGGEPGPEPRFEPESEHTAGFRPPKLGPRGTSRAGIVGAPSVETILRKRRD